MSLFSKSIAALLVWMCLFSGGNALAGTLAVDWNSGTWTWPEGDLTRTTNVSDIEDDIDVNWAFSGDTDEFNKSPVLSNRIKGGADADTLNWRFRPDVTTDAITLEITFVDVVSGLGTNVENFSMLMYDIDRDDPVLADSQWTDRLSFIGSLGATTYDPIFSGLGSMVAADGPNALIGTDKNNNNDADGNATISFAGPIDKITIVFQDDVSGDFSANKDHEIGIRSIQFTPIPEPSAVFLVMIAVAIRVAYGRKRPGDPKASRG